MKNRFSNNPQAGIGQLGGVLMLATHAGQNVQRNLSRPRYTPAPQPQCRLQPQAQQQARPKAYPQPCYQLSPTEIFNVRVAILTGQKIPVNLPRRLR
jgi:hypothetical protein